MRITQFSKIVDCRLINANQESCDVSVIFMECDQKFFQGLISQLRGEVIEANDRLQRTVSSGHFFKASNFHQIVTSIIIIILFICHYNHNTF